MAELTELSARALSARLAAGELSAVELMRATLDRIAAVNPGLNAVVSLRDEDPLMAEAASVDAGPRRGWLHGLPMAIKDLALTAGLRTTMGSPLMADFIPDQDELMVARLKAAGAIVIGKTNTPEFGLGSNTFNPVHGATRNPYDRGRTCGGSSGGAAVALAARMVALADGSDMMGSLRNPAAWNNVYGMRPSYGLVPGDGTGDLFLHPLATLGPMARDPLDLAGLLQVQAGPDPRQPWGGNFDAAALEEEPDIRGVRIGWLGDWGGAYTMEDGLLDLAGAGLAVFETLGAVVEPVPPPMPREVIWDAWVTLRSWAVAAKLAPLLEDPAKRDRLKGSAIWEIETGRSHSAMALHAASVAASDWYRRAAGLFQCYDALVLPTTQVWPFQADKEYPTEIAGVAMDSYHRWMEVTLPVSLIGLPAVNLPVGFGAGGLPAGMQVFGPRGADLAMLRLAQAYHNVTDWPNARPPTL